MATLRGFATEGLDLTRAQPLGLDFSAHLKLSSAAYVLRVAVLLMNVMC